LQERLKAERGTLKEKGVGEMVLIGDVGAIAPPSYNCGVERSPHPTMSPNYTIDGFWDAEVAPSEHTPASPQVQLKAELQKGIDDIEARRYVTYTSGQDIATHIKTLARQQQISKQSVVARPTRKQTRNHPKKK
jgi:hypothetical protein